MAKLRIYVHMPMGIAKIAGMDIPGRLKPPQSRYVPLSLLARSADMPDASTDAPCVLNIMRIPKSALMEKLRWVLAAVEGITMSRSDRFLMMVVVVVVVGGSATVATPWGFIYLKGVVPSPTWVFPARSSAVTTDILTTTVLPNCLSALRRFLLPENSHGYRI